MEEDGNMKKNIFVVAILIFTGCLSAAELTLQGDTIVAGKQRFTVTKSGTLFLSVEGKSVSNFFASIGTKHKNRWFNPGMAVCKPTLKTSKPGEWEFTSKIPANETEFLDFNITMKRTPANKIELYYAWDTPDWKNILEVGIFLSIPMAAIVGKNVILNGEVFKVVNETKYGWLDKKDVENPTFTIFKDESGFEYSVSAGGKVQIVFQSVKGEHFTIRFYPRGEEDLTLTITPK